MKKKATEIRLEDYQAPAFTISRVYLHFELAAEQTDVYAQYHIKKIKPVTALSLDGQQLTLNSVHLDGQLLQSNQYTVTAETLVIHDVPEQFVLDISTRISPQKNTSLTGLYQSQSLLSTQCEAHGFRRIIYYLDRPDVMSVFTTSLVANRANYPVLLANGDRVAYHLLPQDKHMAIWHDPHPKPCYLFALVAGPLTCLEQSYQTLSNRSIRIQLYTEPQYQHACIFALEALKRAMRWDEQTYGREYDLDTLMLVAVSDFNHGAMENKGLNIFNAKCVLAHPDFSTDDDYLRVESVIAHEYFHNWTGNRITCQNWFHLSLKEGLTVFREQQYMQEIYPDLPTRLQAIRLVLENQFPEDTSPLAHPVIPKSYVEINNFYTYTIYEKGAELIWMLFHLLGVAQFKQGMDYYFKQYDGCAVTIDDFLQAMQQATSFDLRQFRQWYDQIGTPKVLCTASYQAAKEYMQITLQQIKPDNDPVSTNYPLLFPIKLSFINPKGDFYQTVDEKDSTHPIHSWVLDDWQMSQNFKKVPKDAILALHHDFTAPVKIEYQQDNQALQAIMMSNLDHYTRWQAANRLHMRYLQDALCYIHQPSSSWPNANYLSLFESLLARGEDDQMLAYLISFPSLGYWLDQSTSIDFDAMSQAYQLLTQTVVKHHLSAYRSWYQRLYQKGQSLSLKEGYNQRLLKNTLLRLLAMTQDHSILDLCINQCQTATCFTDKVAGLKALTCYPLETTRSIFEEYFTVWHQQEMLLLKWYEIIACVNSSDIITYCTDLIKQASFDVKNPNKARALLYTFAHFNLPQFHNLSGSGYELIKTQLLRLDAINPQVAARLVQVFAKWHQFDEPRKSMMAQALTVLQTADTASKNLQEVVGKLLKRQ